MLLLDLRLGGMTKAADEDNNPLDEMAIAGLGGILAARVPGPLQNSLHPYINTPSSPMTAAGVETLKRRMQGQDTVILQGSPDDAMWIPNAKSAPMGLGDVSGLPDHDTIVAPMHGWEQHMDELAGTPDMMRVRNAGTNHGHMLAHELGHGQNARRPVLNFLQRINKASKRYGGKGALLAAVIAPEDSTLADYATPALALASHAPTLISEGMATVHAMRGLRNVGVSPQQLSKSRNRLLAAWGTYGLHALGATAAPIAARVIKKELAKQRRESVSQTLRPDIQTAA